MFTHLSDIFVSKLILHTLHFSPLPAERFELDPLTAHTIRLVQHAKKVRLLISNLQTANQENVRIC